MRGYLVYNNNGEFLTLSDELYDIGEHVLVELNSENTVCVIKSKNLEVNNSHSKILRIATAEEISYFQKEKNYLTELKTECERVAKQLKLKMTVASVELEEKNNQIKINFYSDTRVDFREMAKKIGSKYKKRVELRQIGARDKAKAIGALGPCGLVICCSLYLKTFESISINMAKNQLLALNPSKINGQCGRLLCCLGYEDDTYSELKQHLPKLGQFIDNEKAKGKVVEINVLKGSYVVQNEKYERTEVKK